jgi:hypothetical protein
MAVDVPFATSTREGSTRTPERRLWFSAIPSRSSARPRLSV